MRRVAYLVLGAFVAGLLVVACQTAPDPWAFGCSTYARTLTALAGYKNEGRLSPTTILRVDQMVAVAGPICESTTPPDGTSLDRLDAAIFELTRIRDGVK